MTNFASRKLLILGFALLTGLCLTLAAPSQAQAQGGFAITVGSPPPPFPYYDQPFVPGPDYVWTPGYWAWGDSGYFWVPGAWVLAPRPGLLWTPGYWSWTGNAYGWYPGYWARRVGYYGGINYGYGYYGRGYVGGGWYGPHFRYNTAVTRVNTTIIHNVYVDKTVVINNPARTTVTRVSYNGGRGGIVAKPLPTELVVPKHIVTMTPVQREHEHVAAIDRNQLAAVTHNQPRQLAADHVFSEQNHPSTFEHVRPADRVPRQMNPSAPHPVRVPRPNVTHAPPPAMREPPAHVEQRPVAPPRENRDPR